MSVRRRSVTPAEYDGLLGQAVMRCGEIELQAVAVTPTPTTVYLHCLPRTRHLLPTSFLYTPYSLPTYPTYPLRTSYLLPTPFILTPYLLPTYSLLTPYSLPTYLPAYDRKTEQSSYIYSYTTVTKYRPSHPSRSLSTVLYVVP